MFASAVKAGRGDSERSPIYDRTMPQSPGVVPGRRTIATVCAVIAALALVGALIFSFGSVGNGCGSGWEAARKPLPDPLLTPEEQARIQREKLNPYEFSVAKAKPINDCRREGNKRLVTAGVGALLVLLPVGGLLGYLYWPRREDLTDVYLDDDDDVNPDPVPTKRSSWGDFRPGG